MLCGVCRRQVARGSAFCTSCGEPVKKRSKAVSAEPLDLVLKDGTRVPVADTLTIGRAPDNTIQLEDPSVSRHHARIVADGGAPVIEDTGSSAGTFLNDRRLKGKTRLDDGLLIRLGNAELRVERREDASAAGKTIVVRPGATLLVSVFGTAQKVDDKATTFGFKPRVRSGWALKRLSAAEGGDKRFILRDLRGEQFVRMADDEAALFQLMDGRHSLVELMTEAERRYGSGGSGKVANLLADLGDRGFLAGVEKEDEEAAPEGRLKRLLKPHEYVVRWAGPLFERIYKAGGFVFFTRPAFAAMALVGVVGLGVWFYMVAARYGTPFVVAKKVGVGGLVFMVGRFVMVAFHELAHGLTVASFGRRVKRAGLKVMAGFPYFFVDTSEAWFEPQRRRLAISGAGPVSDVVVGGAFSLLGLGTSGTMRDIFFNLAFAAYVGGFFNLNPFLERDGYHMVVDLLREPGLRRRSRQWLSTKLIGQPIEGNPSRIFKIYAVASTIWLGSGLIFAIIGTKRFYPLAVELAPREVVWVALGLIYLLALTPVLLIVGRPLWTRRRVKFVETDDGSG
jgi:putative peptide zinc metalloprotease protein